MATGSHHDFLILGGGTAGCVLAARLSENARHSVCLVEAGPDYGAFDSGCWPADLVDPRAPSDSHDWYPRADMSLSRARVIGGCSAHNAAFVVWGDRRDYDDWAAPGWAFESIEPYLWRAQRTIGTRALEAEELGAWARAVHKAAPEVGILCLEDLNDLSSPVGAAHIPVNVKGFARWNTAFAYLDGARTRENLTVIGDALVDRVLLDRGRARGAVVLVDREPVELGAELVIVSAGAFGSPGLLMRSGIGPADHLTELGIAVAVDLPGVGMNLQDHCGINMVFRAGVELEHELDRQDGTGRLFGSGTIVRAASRACPNRTWDIHLVSWAARDTEGITGGRWRVQLSPYVMKPASAGSVRLRSPDPRESPELDLGFLSDPEAADLAIIVDGAELVRRFAATDALAPLLAAEARPGREHGTRDELASYVRENVRGYFHGVGTCRIGADEDPHAVVDAVGAVRGTERLYICDASIIPTIPRANTNLTTIAIAERIAEIVGRQL
ncbi:MAG: GMC family oxidoreductase [Solirubrobacteraceae bacterium]